MTTPQVSINPTFSQVPVGGQAIGVMWGPIAGGMIVNPASATDQGIAAPEVLFVDLVGPAATMETVTTFPVQPGGSFTVPAGFTETVSVNAETSGHRFSAFALQSATPYPPLPQSGSFPPAGPTTLTEIIPAYVYQQYQDDDDIQAWFAALNTLAQIYTSWFATIALPVYTGEQISGPLLDLVAQGIYGMVRPSLSSGMNRDLGPLNTYAFNTLGYNVRKVVGPSDVTVTSDDIFKRIMTWNFYKGDGNVFNVRWLKRRIMRFLTGTDGTAPNVPQTYAISVSLAPPNAVAIRISVGTRKIIGGALCNRFGFNRLPFNSLLTQFVSPSSPLPYQSVFAEALNSGVLILPFQYSFSVIV